LVSPILPGFPFGSCENRKARQEKSIKTKIRYDVLGVLVVAGKSPYG
jgi:hypothetical protein